MSCTTISLWSGPRNVSTALMYSFAQRPDTTVVDEPLYGYYLNSVDVDHPGDREVVAQMELDPEKVIAQCYAKSGETPYRFLKQMAHHIEKLDLSILELGCNILLTRDPRMVIGSLRKQIPIPTMRDTGFRAQHAIVRYLKSHQLPIRVIDSVQLLANPQHVLTRLCDALRMDFDTAMLSWPRGPKPYDGIWAPHWYHRVHQSTGFSAPRSRLPLLNHHDNNLAQLCMPIYEELLEFHI